MYKRQPLAATEGEEFDVPEYVVRRKILAHDPLSSSQSFIVNVLVLLAGLLGLRMCPDCPHCNAENSKRCCQDCFGSNATAMGGSCGRSDGLVGGQECQKGGTLHLHFKFFLQRLHQLATLKEIVALLQKGLVHVNDFRRFHQHLADASYHNKEHWEAQRDTIEKDLPTFAKEQRLSLLPFFVASDKGCLLYTSPSPRD